MSENNEGLELEDVLTELEKADVQVEDDSLKVEFDKAIEASAEERAKSPFLAAAQTHAMIWNGFQQSVNDLTSADLKRIIIYLTGYPFYIKEFSGNNPSAAGVAYRASKLVEAKSAMILCKAIEQEARLAKALDEQESLVEKLDPENFPTTEDNAKESVHTVTLLNGELKVENHGNE